MDAYKRGIAGIESKGAGDYNALGKVLANGDQALGKYQIMQSNLPQWSKDALGQPITREQFLKSPELQDKIFEHRFGQYVQKYGEEGAARAWYAGEKGMKNLGKTDVHGRLTVADYGKQFAGSLGKDGETKLAGPVSELPKEPKSRNFAGVPSDAGITSEGQPTTDVRPGIVKPDSGVYSDAGITSEGAATSEPPPMPDMGGGGGIGGGALDAGKDFAGGGGDAGGGFDFGKAFGGFGEEIGKAAENMGKMAGNANASRGQNPYVVGAGQMSQPGGPIPIIDPRMVEAQKQQLAMAMQRLNAGKLF